MSTISIALYTNWEDISTAASLAGGNAETDCSWLGKDETNPDLGVLQFNEEKINATQFESAFQNQNIAAIKDAAMKLDVKDKAKKLIADCDWSALPDVGLVNQSDFIAYRAALRALIINPVANPVWPTEPTPEWG